MNNEFKKIFGVNYRTKACPMLFGTKIPDGYHFTENTFFIIENKAKLSDLNKGKEQLFNYWKNLPVIEGCIKHVLILGLGSNESEFTYIIYENGIETKNKLDYYKTTKKMQFDIKKIHELNQYLYDKGINLPKSQKTLFIASILICLKIDPEFNLNTSGFNIADKMIDLINNYYKDVTFTQTFQFIKKSIHNNNLAELFEKLKNMIHDYGLDILNAFYSEFCIFDRNNDASLGVVLTPDDIVELMIELLNIQENDSICDFCTGTGSFLIKSKAKKLIGCENNEERYSLAKCNFILNNLDYSHLYYNSCFNQNFDKYDKVIINPPFSCNCPDSLVEIDETNWKKYNGEQKFILYQVQLLKENGIGAVIIPRSNINNSNKKSNLFKIELLKHVQILKIINCNSKVFMPNASVECAIIIFKKCKNLSKNVEIINYLDDGYELKKNIRIKIKDSIIKKQIKNLTHENDWNYIEEINIDIDILKVISEYNNNLNYAMNKILILNKEYDKCSFKIFIEYNIFKDWDKLKINDYFIIIKPKKIFKISITNNGMIPLISSSGQNNGISKFIDDFSYEGDCITVARNGTVGSSFYQTKKIGVTTDIIILKPISNVNLYIWSIMLNYTLPQKYSYNNKITLDKLMNEIILIPH